MLTKEYCEALQAMKDQASAATAQIVASDRKAKRGELADAQRRMVHHDKESRTIYRLLMGSGDKNLTIDTLDESRLAQELVRLNGM